MVNVHPEYVVDEQQNRKAVLLSVSEWEQIVSELEELDDIRVYDAAQKYRSDRIPFATTKNHRRNLEPRG